MADTETSRIVRGAAAEPPALFGGGVIAALAASPRAEALVAEAARVAGSWGLPLSFLNVGGDDAAREALRELVAARAPAAELILADGPRVDAALCAAAKERGAGLILLGALEHEAGLAWYRGSIARRVARQAPCSVLLLAHPRLEPKPFARPQVTIHEAERAKPLFALALALARREGAKDLHAVAEYDTHGLHSAASSDDGSAEADLQALQHQEELALATFVAGFGATDVTVRRYCAAGRRGFAAIEHARAHGRDLLLWRAPARRGGLLDKLFPQDSELALRDLACPLLLYRQPRGRGRTATISRGPGTGTP